MSRSSFTHSDESNQDLNEISIVVQHCSERRVTVALMQCPVLQASLKFRSARVTASVQQIAALLR